MQQCDASSVCVVWFGVAGRLRACQLTPTTLSVLWLLLLPAVAGPRSGLLLTSEPATQIHLCRPCLRQGDCAHVPADTWAAANACSNLLAYSDHVVWFDVAGRLRAHVS
jgi:hypothetical protein